MLKGVFDMKSLSRLSLAVAVLLLIGAYFVPIWSIDLEAPQYPEGIGLHVRINTIEGKNPHDLRNINGLNHYIGMKEIQPDAVLLLKLLPYLFGAVIGLGALAVILNKQKLAVAFVMSFALVGMVSFADFYRWEYDYGHNLNPNAAIKVPGMVYQPPLIGSKKLLNFTATSLPTTGGYMMLAAFLLGGFAALHSSRYCPIDWLRNRNGKAKNGSDKFLDESIIKEVEAITEQRQKERQYVAK